VLGIRERETTQADRTRRSTAKRYASKHQYSGRPAMHRYVGDLLVITDGLTEDKPSEALTNASMKDAAAAVCLCLSA